MYIYYCIRILSGTHQSWFYECIVTTRLIVVVHNSAIEIEIFLPRGNPRYPSNQRKCSSEETGNHHSEDLLLSSSLQVSVSCPSPCSPLATLRSLIGQCHNVRMQGPVFNHRISISYLTDCASDYLPPMQSTLSCRQKPQSPIEGQHIY